MTGAARQFMTLAILFAIAGMALGLHMAMAHDHGETVTHTHIMLAGWVSSALMGLFYHAMPKLNASGLARAQFWLSAAGAVVMTVSLFFFYGGNAAAEPGAAVGAIAYLLGFLLFAFIALRGIWAA